MRVRLKFWMGSLSAALATAAAALPLALRGLPHPPTPSPSSFAALTGAGETQTRNLPLPNLGEGRGEVLETYSLRWTPSRTNAKQIVIEVAGLSDASLQALQRGNRTLEDWQRLLAVTVQQDENPPDESVPPMLGTYSIAEKALRFEPKFPLQVGVTYRAVFRPALLPGGEDNTAAPLSSVFRLPPRKVTSTTFVRKIYPGADVLPENLLKFYVYFSAPMRRGGIYDYIHLLDAQGKEIELPFLQIDEELWDTMLTRLTLFFDPGRIKRGVLPLEEVGPALEAGKRYTLVIDREWKDSAGNPLKAEYRKAFRVGPPDRAPPDPTQWKMQPPKSGTRAPLLVTFPEPMEHALAQRFLHVTDRAGKSVAGKIALSDAERRWAFTPESPWRPGNYSLVIRAILEDLAGNNIGKPFDVDLSAGGTQRLKTATVKRAFVAR